MNKFTHLKLQRTNNFHLIKFIYSYKRQVLILFLLGLSSNAFFLIAPYLSSLFVDKVFLSKNIKNFISFSSWGMGIFIASALITYAGDIAKNRIIVIFKLNLANKSMRKFYSFDFGFFQSRSSGENTYRFSDLEAIANFVLEQCPQILIDISRLVIILAIAFRLSFQMAILLIILSPVFLIHNLYIQRKLRHVYEQIWRQGVHQSRQAYESFSKILIVKAFGLELYQRHKYLRSLLKNIRWRMKGFRWNAAASLISLFLSKAIYGLITLYGAWLIISGRLQLGIYTAVMIYITQLGGILESLAHRFARLAQERVSLAEFLSIMDISPRIRDLSGARNLEKMRGEVEFKDVCFGYNGKKPVLNNFNLVIPAFSLVGIAGPSGCGKTTLINLIIRLYEPSSGRVHLDGLDVKMIKLKSLKQRLAIATQQPFLFDVSIGENIAYGLKGVNRQEVERAAKICCSHDFVQSLPEGYATLIGEDGCRLSQGQKQRISLARAIIRNPDVLILDEATSSVDYFTEEGIFKNLREERQGKSTIIISHRLFSIKDADKIYFMSGNGGVKEGRHNQLLAENESYRDFFHSQISLS